MPTAQVIQLDRYRQIPPEQPQSSRIDRVRQLLSDATSETSKSDIFETRLISMENQLADVLNILRSEGGQK